MLALELQKGKGKGGWLQQEQIGESCMAVDYPSAEQLEGFYQHLEQTLMKTGFIADDHPGHVLSKLRRLFNRARPEAAELNILRGILTSVQRSRTPD